MSERHDCIIIQRRTYLSQKPTKSVHDRAIIKRKCDYPASQQIAWLSRPKAWLYYKPQKEWLHCKPAKSLAIPQVDPKEQNEFSAKTRTFTELKSGSHSTCYHQSHRSSTYVERRKPLELHHYLMSTPANHRSIRECRKIRRLHTKTHSRPLRPRSFWSAPRIATPGQVQSVNRGLPLLDLARGRDSWCWPKEARPLGTRMTKTKTK